MVRNFFFQTFQIMTNIFYHDKIGVDDRIDEGIEEISRLRLAYLARDRGNPIPYIGGDIACFFLKCNYKVFS